MRPYTRQERTWPSSDSRQRAQRGLRDHPYRLNVEGFSATVDYEPAESTTNMFGGNSNWRGPLWFPLNDLCGQRA